jgi:phenylacetate-CoA ligase
MSADALLLERFPLLDQAGITMLARLREHPDAPRFNHATGDRLQAEDVATIEALRATLACGRDGERAPAPSAAILQRVAAWREIVPLYRRIVPAELDLGSEWQAVPTFSRHDLAIAPWGLVPDDQPIDRLVIYRTAGTTGHPISVPHHPLAIRCYEPLLEHALARHGVQLDLGPEVVGCILIGAQIRTYTYAAVLHTWRGAGFAKINIRPTEWPREGSQRRYIGDMAPQLLTGDPISFAELAHLEAPVAPRALVSTSVAMSPALKQRLHEVFGAPVIDWYSLVETGPIAAICPRGDAYHVLAPDLFVEALRPDGTACIPGERGEITVTGGRNPFCPLLRYRTGDWGRLSFEPCPCGDPMPRILELEGRAPILFRSADGTPVSTVDLSRLLREHPLLLHEFVQHADRSCELICRAVPGASPDAEMITEDLLRVLGNVPLKVRFDPRLGDRTEGKTQAYRSELMVED